MTTRSILSGLALLAASILLAGCTEWPEFPPRTPLPANPPQLIPLDAVPTDPSDPAAEAAALQARADALTGRANDIRGQ